MVSQKTEHMETSTFGSEFVAMKIVVKLLQGISYKLHMMGITLDCPTNIFCDNEAVNTEEETCGNMLSSGTRGMHNGDGTDC
jgi:hypothetical protein